MISHQAFHSATAQLGIDTQALTTRFIFARDVSETGRILPHLAEILNDATTYGVELGVSHDLSTLLPVVQALLQDNDTLRSLLGPDWTRPRVGRGDTSNPVIGDAASRAATWALLFEQAEDPSLQVPLNRLTGAMLIATLRLTATAKHPEQYASYVSGTHANPAGAAQAAFAAAGRAIRLLARTEHHGLLNNLGAFKSITGLCALCKRPTFPTTASQHTKILKPLDSFLRLVLGYRPISVREAQRPRRVDTCEFRDGMAFETLCDANGSSLRTRISKLNERPTAEEGQDTHPLEHATQLQYVQACPSVPPSNRRAEYAKAQRMRSGQIARLSASTLMTSNTTQDLGPKTLSKLINFFSSGRPSTKIECEVLALLHASLWLGQPINHLAGARFSLSILSCDGDIEYLLDIFCWRIKPPRPVLVTAPTSAEKENSHAVSSHLLLPDAGGFCDVLPFTFSPSRQIPGELIFNIKLFSKAESYAKKLLASDGLGHISPRAIPRQMQQAILNACPSFTVLALLTNVMRAHAHVELHYTTLEASFLQRVYCDAALSFGSQNVGSGVVPRQDGFVGSPRCPTTDVVKSTIISLKARLQHANSDIDRHNIYTAYCHFVISLNLTLRALVDHRFLQDCREGVIAFVDKSDAEGYHRRLAWLTPIVDRLNRDYCAYRVKVIQRHVYLRSAIPDLLSHFFIFDPLGRPQPYRPLDVATHVPEFGLPINSLRRFVASEMYRLGANGDENSIVLGHWSPGREPWVRGSGYTIPKMKALYEKYLGAIVETAGVSHVPSPVWSAP